MKKKVLIFTIATIVVALAGWNVSQSRNEAALSDMALANVEALAQGESAGFACEFAYVVVCKWFSDGSFAPGNYIGDVIAY
jgi:hypothetical protein